MKKLKKLVTKPGLFFRDYLNKRHPVIRNEINCPLDDEAVLIQHDTILEKILPIEFPIDAVFTWVNDDDHVWKKKYYDALYNIDQSVGHKNATNKSRFSNHDELKFSIQSVLIFLPWIRHIYIVTDNQEPCWFKDNKKISIIDHKAIIRANYLPTFNSHVIEAHLHRIKGLSEHFIYFNDDVFVARHIPPGHFFRGNGISSLFLAQKSLEEMKKKGINTPTLQASINVKNLIFKKLNAIIDIPLTHTYIPLRKSSFVYVWDNFNEDIERFLKNKFRSNNDLNLASFFVPWIMYLSGDAVPTRDICHYFNIRSPAASCHWKHLKNSQEKWRPHSFCANDFISQSDKETLKDEISNHLSEIYSHQCKNQ